ncbi:hypothetical protein ColKHC_04604 [Colletotrichum higginsianum]|nr:hypothetical protein ColKHC_04604 [Colletotrichum higginsianum]
MHIGTSQTPVFLYAVPPPVSFASAATAATSPASIHVISSMFASIVHGSMPMPGGIESKFRFINEVGSALGAYCSPLESHVDEEDDDVAAPIPAPPIMAFWMLVMLICGLGADFIMPVARNRPIPKPPTPSIPLLEGGGAARMFALEGKVPLNTPALA